jgi:asparagine synthase (glutamine-hydrolysing)
VTVALSGDGGDELFAGYGEKYRMHLMEERLRSFIPAPLRRGLFPALGRRWPRSPRLPRALRLGGLFRNLAVEAPRSYDFDRRLIPPHLEERLLGGRRRFDPFVAIEPHLVRAPKEPLARALYLDLKTWMADDGLVKVDRMSMAHALEVRCPLLDHRIIEFAARLPARLKLASTTAGTTTKVLLRRVAGRRLPAEILARPKRGFAPPVSRWLREDLRDFSRDLLLAPDAYGRGLFETREVERLLDDHAARRLDAGWALWTLLMLEVWGREVARAAAAPVTSGLVEVPSAVGA